jgi:hypothetical protein
LTPGNPVEALAVAKAMREWAWLYPSVEIVHILGFSLLVGSVTMFDLRVLGVARHIPVRALARYLLPWGLGALVLIVPTGLMMFSAHAGDFVSNPAFQLKMSLLLAAGLNAAWFHRGPYASVKEWDVAMRAPMAARLSVALSLLLWVSIVSCGRLLAYL